MKFFNSNSNIIAALSNPFTIVIMNAATGSLIRGLRDTNTDPTNDIKINPFSMVIDKAETEVYFALTVN